MSAETASGPVRRILLLTGGHRVEFDALFEMMTSICAERGWLWAHAHQPAAQRWLDPSSAGEWDALLCHDLPGLRLKRGEAPAPVGPDGAVKADLVELLKRGQGLVFLHHALAGWPAWDGWARALGGRFLYAPGSLRGTMWPSSGTRITHYTARIVGSGHPVCDGLDDFELTDELYCCPVFADEVVPLLRTDADLDRRRFVSTYEHVLHGAEAAPDCSAHPPASDLIGWATVAERSPVVYLQPGDSGATFALVPYRRLVANALDWVASPMAREWAGAHPVPLED